MRIASRQRVGWEGTIPHGESGGVRRNLEEAWQERATSSTNEGHGGACFWGLEAQHTAEENLEAQARRSSPTLGEIVVSKLHNLVSKLHG